jgi:magnesium transporter
MRNILKGPNVTWIDIQDPQKEDIEYLRKDFNFHHLVLEQLIPPSWSTKVETFSDHLLLILFFPSYNEEKRESRPRELDIIVTKDALITSHYDPMPSLKEVFDKCNLHAEEKGQWMTRGAGYFLYHVLQTLWEDCSAKVNRIDRKLAAIEESLFLGKEREMLKEISIVKTNIIAFWKIVRPQKGPFTSLRDLSGKFFGSEFAPYFSNLRNHWARVASSVLTQKDTVESFEDTNAALLSHKTNEIVKVLTIFSVIVMPLAILSQIFGMNTSSLPLQDNPRGFWIITTVMILGMFVFFLYFKKKKWL